MKVPPGVLQSVLVALLLGVLGAAWSTYLTAHDTARDVDSLKTKVDWLYRYTVPGHVEAP